MTPKSAHPPQPVEIKLDLARTPSVRPAALQKALEIAQALTSGPDPIRGPEDFANALLRAFGPGDHSLALWARTRALLRYIQKGSSAGAHKPKAKGAPEVSEAPRGPQIATNGYSSTTSVSPDKSSAMIESLTLILAASKHPLTSDGSFAEGFEDTLRIAQRALLSGTVN